MMKDLPYIPRLSEMDRISGFTQPWEYESKEVITDEMRSTKLARMDWANNPKTEHCFFSGFVGLNPDGRISRMNENPAAQMLAVVVDYDGGNQDLDKFLKMVEKYDVQYPPNYITNSIGGGMHAVWIFESPVNVDEKLLKGLMNEISDGLKLPKLAKHFDKDALYDTSKYYTAGDSWRKVSSVLIPDAQVKFWMKEALKTGTLRLGDDASIDIPLDLAYAEAVKIYGDKMADVDGFEFGMRCRRFWDATAKDATGAYLMENGFCCHSGDEVFKDWTSLLGPNFVAKYKVQQYEELTKETYYNGKQYIYFNEANKRWTVQTAPDVVLRYNVDFGISKSPPKRGEPSEIDDIMRNIQKTKTVSGGFANFVHRKEGLYTFQGHDYINMSQVKALPPSGRMGEWGELFPFLAEFFDNLFQNDFEKNLVLAWWKRSYKGALNYEPKRGQILLMAGPKGCGKTLFNDKMLSPSLGGSMDAADFYVNGAMFSDMLYNTGLHTVDDAEPNHHPSARKKMAARLKRTAASSSISVNGKNKDLVQIEWIGRVCITMNDDVESLKATPELQETLKDKMIAVRAVGATSGVLDRESEEIESLIKSELPHLLQWLLDWTPPEEVMGGKRYGVADYCNLQLKRDMESGSSDQIFVEFLETYLAEYSATAEGKEADHLLIGPGMLIENMKNCELIKRGMHAFSPERVGHVFGRLQAKGYKFEKMDYRKNNHVVWNIPYDFYPEEDDD